MDKTVTPVSFFTQLALIWRILATGFGFAMFGIGSILLSLVVFPLISLSIQNEEKCHALSQKIIRKSFCLFIGTLSFLKALSYRFENMECLQNDHGTIIVANHPSLLDIVLIASRMPRCDCIVKEALFKNFFLKGVVKAAGYIPNANAETLLNDCQQKLRQSGMLVIFPEGTRTKADKPITLQRGVANIALRTHSNIRIVTVYCSQCILTKEQKWYQTSAQKPEFIISAHEKLIIDDFINQENPLAIDARHLTDFLQKQLTDHIEQIKLSNGEHKHEFKTGTKTAHY